MQSSRVGVSTIAWTSACSGSMYSSIGRPNAAVLPVPVWAWPITSLPSSSAGIVSSWIGVGRSYPRWESASRMGFESPSSANVIGSTLRGRVEQQLASGAASLQVLVCLSHLGQRVGAAHLRSEVAAGHALEQVAQRLLHHLAAAEA